MNELPCTVAFSGAPCVLFLFHFFATTAHSCRSNVLLILQKKINKNDHSNNYEINSDSTCPFVSYVNVFLSTVKKIIH